MPARLAAAALLALLLAGCGGSPPHVYSVKQVRRAFDRAGVPLRVVDTRFAMQPLNGTLLAGDVGNDMSAIVYHDAGRAKEVFRAAKRKEGPRSLDRLVGNVLVTADGLTPGQERRVLAAVDALGRLG
jgi:hypothetical protein